MKTVSKLALSYRTRFPDSLSPFLPKRFVVPFNQLSDKRYKCLVKEGEPVMEGQLIAFPMKDDGSEEAAVNSPVPGVAGPVVKCRLPNGRMGQGLEINLSGSFSFLGKSEEARDWKAVGQDDVLKLLLAKGVVNTFDGCASLVSQISSCREKGGGFLVVRLFDEDPSRCTDSFIGSKHTREVAEGASILASMMNAQGIVFLLPKNGGVSIENKFVSDFAVLTLELDDSKYPCGFKENIIRTVRKYVRNTQSEYFGGINGNSLFVDSGTLLNVYGAIVLGKPVIESFVEVKGSCLMSSAIFKVRHGTSIADLARQCGGFKTKPERVVVNGMLCGTMLSDFDVPITKSVKSLTFISGAQMYNQDFTACIRCGNCRGVCPEQLFPDVLAGPVIFDVPDDGCFSESKALCSGCRLCNAVCPSHIPLAQIISLLKNEEGV
ncbi:MAG: hypothetical protein IJR93_06420 [Treponema sp.]|nr:hypothetical protein [Treponema sp.]